jgi:segregation and condensation protein A
MVTTETNQEELKDSQSPVDAAADAIDEQLAIVNGKALTQLPLDLYIPPDALEIFLAETFSGPLDLLLYLIKKENLDILNIPIAEITKQYMEYVDVIKDIRLELAGDYLVMAAMLAEIKSRMLLPRPVELEDEDDPRAELIRRLQEYERFKQAAEDLDSLPRLNRDIYPVVVSPPKLTLVKPKPTVELGDILAALNDVMKRAEMFTHHHIQREALSVRERMSKVMSAVSRDHFTDFTTLFPHEEGRMGVVVTLVAILELIKESLIELVQNEPYGSIHVKAV